MKISNGELVLESLKYEHIHLLRAWRNAAHVRFNLLNQEEISEELQELWYERIDPKTQLHFIIYVESNPVGLIYANNISLSNRSFEGNIFIGEVPYLNSPVVVRATIIISHLFFFVFKFNYAYSKVLKHNEDAWLLDKSMGYKLLERTENYDLLICYKSDYDISTEKFRRALFRQHRFMNIEFEQEDVKNSFVSDDLDREELIKNKNLIIDIYAVK